MRSLNQKAPFCAALFFVALTAGCSSAPTETSSAAPVLPAKSAQPMAPTGAPGGPTTASAPKDALSNPNLPSDMKSKIEQGMKDGSIK